MSTGADSAPGVRIVEAESPDDMRAASELFLGYAEELGWDLSQGGRFADEIADPPGPYAPPHGALLLAFVGATPAGVLGVQPVPDEARIPGTNAETAGELKRLFVRPEYRRLGVGEALLRRAEQTARRLGYRFLVLTTSTEMMPLAQGLYDRLGYALTEPYRDDMPYPDIRWLKLEL